VDEPENPMRKIAILFFVIIDVSTALSAKAMEKKTPARPKPIARDVSLSLFEAYL
jgi:hypothetical protein